MTSTVTAAVDSAANVVAEYLPQGDHEVAELATVVAKRSLRTFLEGLDPRQVALLCSTEGSDGPSTREIVRFIKAITPAAP